MPKSCPNFEDRDIMEGWYRIFKYKDQALLHKALRELLETKTFFPSIAEVRAQYQEYENKQAKRAQENRLNTFIKKDYKCRDCKDTGMISAIRKDELLTHPFTFRCHCDIGFNLSKSIPIWGMYQTSPDWTKI